MNRLEIVILTLLFGSFTTALLERGENDGDESEEFIATSEWKTIKPGQEIGRGLHVRMNLQTGHKEAKLIDKEDDTEPIYALQPNYDDVNVVENIKDAIRNIPDDGANLKEGSKGQFRSIDELKDEFDGLNMQMTTESEIVERFVEELKIGAATMQLTIQIQLELEYYVHQFDNARDFVKSGGLEVTIPFLESPSDDIRGSAAFLLGSSMQSNPSVQVSAAESGLIEKLLNCLRADTSVAVQNKMLYALSCLLRRFPHAQERFLEFGGLRVLTSVFEKYGREMERLQRKTVTLVYDLVVEDHFAMEQDDGLSANEKARQYGRVGMKRAVIEARWCDVVPKLLNSTDHDTIETVLKMMALISKDCRAEFLTLHHRLVVLRDEFSRRVDHDNDDIDVSYIYELLQTVVTLLKELEGSTRDEL